MSKKLFVFLLVAVMVVGMASLAMAEKVYKVGIGEDPTTMNMWSALGPGDATMYNYVVTSGYYSSLYGYADYSFAFVPSLAADMPGEFKKEGDYYTSIVPLRKGLKWSDGNEFTADDVVFTYQTLIDLDLQGNWASYHPDILAKVEKIDDYTVKFYLTEIPGLAEWNYGILMGAIMSKAKWGSIVEEAKKQDDPAQYLYAVEVTDPVTLAGLDFAKWEKGAFWQNVPAEYYAGGGETRIYVNGRHEIEEGDWSWAGYGPEGSDLELKVETGPFVDSVIYRLYLNQDSMIMALKKGDIDYMLSAQGLTKGFREELQGTPGIEVVANPSNGFRYMCFNRGRYPFSIVEFNQAVATLIDRDYVMNSVLQGAGIPNASPVPPGNSYWYNPNIKVWGEGMSRAERVAQAVELLEKAGFSWEQKPVVDLENDTYTPGSGIIMPNGEKMKPFDIMTPPAGYDPLRATFGLWIQLWLNDLGIPARSVPTQFNVISEKVFNTGDFDAFILGWGLGLYPDHLYAFFHSEGGFNCNSFSDPVFDQIIEEFMKAQDLTSARELLFAAQERLAETLPYIVLFSTPIYDAYRKDKIQFPYTDLLDGIQGLYGMPTTVKVID